MCVLMLVKFFSFKEISHFFEVYKFLEEKETAVNEILGRKAAEEIIEKCLVNYQKRFGKEENNG